MNGRQRADRSTGPGTEWRPLALSERQRARRSMRPAVVNRTPDRLLALSERQRARWCGADPGWSGVTPWNR